MKITEQNIQKVSDRVYHLRQQWRRRVRISHVVHYVASSVFFLLSVVYAYSLLPLFLPKELQGNSSYLLGYLGRAWNFLQHSLSVPGQPALSAFTVFLAPFAISFLAAAVAAVIVALQYRAEPRPKVKGLKYNSIHSMYTGLRIYQEHIKFFEGFHGKLNSILSLAFSLLLTGMVAHALVSLGQFKTYWEVFLGWAIFGTAISWAAHRLLLGLMSFPVSLLYCFGAPAPGLRKALEKKTEELKPVYKYVDKPKEEPKSYPPSPMGTEDMLRIMRKAEEMVNGKPYTPSYLKDDPYALAGDWGHVDTSDI